MYKSRVDTFLLLGSLPQKGLHSTFGGTTVLMKSLKDYFDLKSISYHKIVLNTYKNPLLKLLSTCNQLNKKIFHSTILFLNISNNGAFVMGTIVYVYAVVFKRDMIFRLFGSNFEKSYNSKLKIIQFIADKTFFKSNLIIVETKQNHDFFKNKGCKNIYQLPNVRKKRNDNLSKVSFSKRFVFISHVKKSKGVLDIIKASKKLPKDYILDFYGPINEDIDVEVFSNTMIKYRGVLEPNDVINTLMNYDVVLLPSYYEGEGQPGILIEAMSIGIPAIATKWNSIPEVIVDGYNGLLVSVKNPEELAKSILSFNNENYKLFTENCRHKFKEFEETAAYEKLLNRIDSIKYE